MKRYIKASDNYDNSEFYVFKTRIVIDSTFKLRYANEYVANSLYDVMGEYIINGDCETFDNLEDARSYYKTRTYHGRSLPTPHFDFDKKLVVPIYVLAYYDSNTQGYELIDYEDVAWGNIEELLWSIK